jgi:tRNA(Ile)-lysidine synthase
MKDLLKLIRGRTGRQIYTKDYRLFKNRNELVISKKDSEPVSSCEITDIEDFIKYPGCVSARIIKLEEWFKIPVSLQIACLDAGKVSFPMVIRKWKHGDSFYPLGMTRKKKLSDYFIDKKYSILEKEQCIILESEGKIVWVMNERIDNRFRITKSTKKALLLEFKF